MSNGQQNKDKIMQMLREVNEESMSIKPYVVVAQPRRNAEEVPAQNFKGYSGVHVDFLGYSRGYVFTDNLPIDVARNILIQQTIESGAKYLLFVDEDTVLPYDAFLTLHETAETHKGDVVAGVYYIKLSSPMIMIKKDDYIVPANVDPGQLLEAFMIGFGCCLIPVELLIRMQEEDPEIPFCCVGPEGLDGLPFIGEDNFFFYRAKKLGARLLVNTDVQCLHCDLASGQYTAHPSVDLANYITNIEITTPFIMEDKKYVDYRQASRIPTLESREEK